MIRLPESLPCVATEDPWQRVHLHYIFPREWTLNVRKNTSKQTAVGLQVRHKKLSWRTQKRVTIAYLSLGLVCPLGSPRWEALLGSVAVTKE